MFIKINATIGMTQENAFYFKYYGIKKSDTASVSDSY